MLEKINLEKVLFLDIETAPQTYKYDDLDSSKKHLFESKTRFMHNEEKSYEMIYGERSSIYAEFGKIICISVGYLKKVEGKEQFRMKSFFGDDEKILLQNFAELLAKHFARPEHRLCGHNGKEFDFPWIARRMLVHGIELPFLLDTSGKKPWETTHLDTMEMWKFGDFKNHTSLNLLAALFGIPTPKDDIDGSQVHKVYYEEKNLDRIVAYCQKDVLTVAQLIKKFRGESLIPPDAVIIQ